MREIEVPVLIVGGGGAGLTSSLLLSSYGVRSLLVSRYPGTSHLPKAHVLHQRTMEVFRELGVADDVLAASTPAENMRATAWYAGFAGPREEYGRSIGRMACWGDGYRDPNWVRASPCRSANLPQIRLEPILRRHAEERAEADVRFGHELVDLEQAGDEVLATIEDRGSGERLRVRSRFALGCDGGRTVGARIGAVMEGPTDLASNVSVHLSADLSPWMDDDEVLLRWYINPDIGDPLSCVLVPMGPERWGARSEEWVFHLIFPLGDPRHLDDEFIVRHMRHVLGVPDLQADVHLISRWTLEGIVASTLRVGGVFLLGDAAHRHPPTGGLGLNTAVGDAYDLCWKLAAVLAGHAGEELLASYETERKPVGARAVARSLENWMNHPRATEVLGITMDAGPEENWRRMRMLWADGAEADALRRRFEDQLATQTMEFDEHAVEYGYTYASPVIADEPRPQPLDDVHVYEPSTRPGHPLPHAYVTRDGREVALRDLVRPGEFLLIAGEQGEAWCEAAAALNAPVRAIRVGPAGGDWLDLRFDWLRTREISSTGAVLVRPDRVVAWRSPGAHPEPLAALRDAMRMALGARAEVVA